MAAEDEQATFTLTLRDEISRTSQGMAGALDTLKKRLADQQRPLSQMEAALKRLKAGGQGSSAAAKELRDRITAQKAAIAGTQGEILRMGESFESAAQPAKTFLGELSKQPGILGAAGRSIGVFKELLGSTVGKMVLGVVALVAFAAGTAAVVGALLSVARAAAEGAIEIARFGLAHADARRNELLHLEALTLVRRHMGLARGTAGELQGAIDRVASTSALGRGELAGYAEQLYRMGLRGDNLSTALEGTAIAASTVGDAYARRFAGMAAGAVRTGGSVRRLADDIRSRLGGVAARQAIGLDAQMRRLREGISGMFDSIDVEPLLRGLNSVTSLFARGSILSRAWGTVFGTIFRPFTTGAEGAGGALRSLILRFTTGTLRAATAVLRIVVALQRVEERLHIVRNLGRATFSEVQTAVEGVGLAIRTVGRGMYQTVATGIAVAGMLRAAWTRARAMFDGTEWEAAGRNITAGLERGVRSGIGSVVARVRELASSAAGALTGALEIRSPSRVFARFGREIPRGLAAGMDDGAGEALGAAGRLAGGVERGFDEAPTGGGTTNAPSSSSTSIGPFYIQVGNQDVAEQLEEQLAGIFERLGLVRGALT